MQHYLHKQYARTRQGLFEEIEQLYPAIVDVQPEGFNNTIRWHIGHILTLTEDMLFGYPEQSKYLPENYLSLFGDGTKPAEWTGDVPDLEKLSAHLTEQFERIKQLPASSFDSNLEEPVYDQETFGELVDLSAFHETYHAGQIHAMQLSIKAALHQ